MKANQAQALGHGFNSDLWWINIKKTWNFQTTHDCGAPPYPFRTQKHVPMYRTVHNPLGTYTVPPRDAQIENLDFITLEKTCYQFITPYRPTAPFRSQHGTNCPNNSTVVPSIAVARTHGSTDNDRRSCTVLPRKTPEHRPRGSSRVLGNSWVPQIAVMF